MDPREEAIRAAAEHVARLRKALDEGRAEIARLHAAVDETRSYLRGEGDRRADDGGA